jgi:hypothetical protein
MGPMYFLFALLFEVGCAQKDPMGKDLRVTYQKKGLQDSLRNQIPAKEPPPSTESSSPVEEPSNADAIGNNESLTPSIKNPPETNLDPVSPVTEHKHVKGSSRQTIQVPKNPDAPCDEHWIEEGGFCARETSLALRFEAKGATLAIKDHLTLNRMSLDGLCHGLKGADLMNGVCVYTGRGKVILQAFCPGGIQGCQFSLPPDWKGTGAEEMFFSFDSGGTQESCEGVNPNLIYSHGVCLMPILIQVNLESMTAYCKGLEGKGLWQPRKDGKVGCEFREGILGTKVYVPGQKPDHPKGEPEFSHGAEPSEKKN